MVHKNWLGGGRRWILHDTYQNIPTTPLIPPRFPPFSRLDLAPPASSSHAALLVEGATRYLHVVGKACVRRLCGCAWCFDIWEEYSSSSGSNSPARSKHDAAVDSSVASNKLFAEPPQPRQRGQTSASSRQKAPASFYSLRRQARTTSIIIYWWGD